ncbi:DUF397 domain-containing protein [Kitasatospora sp. NPDC057500]|uniref:DUF397 domain-containing protein n=1 Tax=Kitasatospora sp. NPDC057500 TaxID=3346151 RepID=UPI003688BBB6
MPGVLPVRDSEDLLGASPMVTPEAWAAFVAGVRAVRCEPAIDGLHPRRDRGGAEG